MSKRTSGNRVEPLTPITPLWIGPDSVTSVGWDELTAPDIVYNEPGDRWGEPIIIKKYRRRRTR